MADVLSVVAMRSPHLLNLGLIMDRQPELNLNESLKINKMRGRKSMWTDFEVNVDRTEVDVDRGKVNVDRAGPSVDKAEVDVDETGGNVPHGGPNLDRIGHDVNDAGGNVDGAECHVGGAGRILGGSEVSPANRLEALKGNRHGQLSIWINQQWRICFRSKDGDAHDVEITDYH